jgi:hypothetical protein
VSDNFSIYLDQITEAVKAAIPDAAFKAMEHVHQVAVEKTPLMTGNLRSESHVDAQPDGAILRYEGPYARYQEFGISHHGKELRHETGQSFYLVTSVIQETPKVLEIVAEELRKVIESP